MSEIQSIEERVVTYYNDLIKNNVIAGKAPVTLEWMKRQRILEGRGELDIRFGSVVINDIFGEKTPLAKAGHYLKVVHKYNKYDLLTKIACLLAEECTTMLALNDPLREKYTSLKTEITFPTIVVTNEEINLDTVFKPIAYKKISILQLEKLISILNTVHCNHDVVYFHIYFLIYIRECIYFALANAFEEIKKAVESMTK